MRLTLDEWGLSIAQVVSQRSTCLRRAVGCVLVNFRGKILSTGYNGRASGLPHCNEPGDPDRTCHGVPIINGIPMNNACPGALSKSGEDLNLCEAIHAEQNALLQCRDVQTIHTTYVTASPCLTCVKLLLNTSCTRIVFAELYPHAGSTRLWMDAGRLWIKA
jgi:dCMP deaminase